MIFSVVALQRWLLTVAGLRALSVFIGIFKPDNFKRTVIDRKPELVNALFGRLFATWTFLSGSLCVLLARDPADKGLYIATTISFVTALGFFLNEVSVHKTVKKGAISPMIVASISTAWLIAGYDTYVNGGKGSGAAGSPRVEL